MLTLGIDLFHTARALVVDDTGRIVSRGTAAEAAAAARKALAKSHVDATGIGVADGTPAPRALDAIAKGAQVFPAGASAVTAEVWIGAARDARNAVSLWIGERIFAGILVEGRPWPGAHGRAGAAAWLALNPVERQDYRKLGSLAAEVGVKGIARRLSWRIQAGDQSAVLERAGDLDAITSTHVFDGARAGDGVAISVVRDTAKYIGMAIANLAATLDPDVVVIGGPVASAADLLLEPVRQECARRLPAGAMDTLRVECSTLGEDGVALGAARLAMTSAR